MTCRTQAQARQLLRRPVRLSPPRLLRLRLLRLLFLLLPLVQIRQFLSVTCLDLRGQLGRLVLPGGAARQAAAAACYPGKRELASKTLLTYY
jgi:hypothetical protein